MGITKDGIEGEQMLFKWIRERGYEFFQPDAISLQEGEYVIYEAKHQERYKPPPFEGHGLPKWQVMARLFFEIKTGIKTILIVFDKETNEIFYNYLSELEKREHIDTHGTKPRRIYKLSSFNTSVLENNLVAGGQR